MKRKNKKLDFSSLLTPEKIKNFFIYLSPSIITFIIFAIIFKKNNIYPFGETSIAWCDLKQQGIPLLMNLKDILSGEGSIMYSFNNAAGMNFWGVFLFFLSNPFSLLCVFFEKAELYKVVCLLTILKLCLSAFTATFFFNKFNKKLDKIFTVALGVSYALCAYGLMYFQNIMWLDLMYLFPILVYGIYKVTEGKGYGLYTLILTLCVIFNFYLSFMIVVSVLLIIGAYLLISGHDKKHKKKVAFDFLLGSAFGAMISSFSWLPAFIQYSKSGRGENIIDSLSSSDFWAPAETIELLVLSTTIIIIGIFALYKPDRKRLIAFSLFALLLTPIYIEPINKMWHMGSYMAFPGRYAFITIFAGLELVALALEDREIRKNSIESPITADETVINTIESPNQSTDVVLDSKNENSSSNKKTKKNKKKQIIAPQQPIKLSLAERIEKKLTPKYTAVLLISIILGVICLVFLLKNISIDYFLKNQKVLSKYITSLWSDAAQYEAVLKVATIFASVYIVSAIAYKIKLIPKTIFSLFLVGVVICEGVFAVNVYCVTVKERNLYNNYETFTDLEGKIEDDSFYRVRTEKKYWDSNLLGALGYNSIGHYTSLTNLDYMNTFKALGYSSHWMELSTYGGTELSDAIMSVKYRVVRTPRDLGIYNNGSYAIMSTFGALGLGVKYTGDDDVFNHEQYSRIDFQEKIFKTIFNTDDTLFQKYTPDLLTNCTISQEDSITEIDGKGSITYYLDIGERQTIYFDAFGEYSNELRQPMDKGFTIYVNGNEKVKTFPNGIYTGLVNLGTYENKKVTIKITTKRNHMSLISFGLAGLRTDLLASKMEQAESGFLEAKDNEVYGTVEGKEGEKLFVSVPYDEGFKVTVNGKKVKPTKVFGDFYSIPLVNGTNKIKMEYTSPGLILGIIVSIIGLAAMIGLYIYKRKKNLGEIELKVNFSILFIILFAIILLAIYIIPLIINTFF